MCLLKISFRQLVVDMIILLLALISSSGAVTLTGSSEYAVPGTEFTLTCDVPEEARLVRFYRRPDITTSVGSIQVGGGQCYNTKASPAVLCTANVCSCVTSGGNLSTVFRWIIQPQTGDQGSVWFCRRTNLNLPNTELDSDNYTLNLAESPGSSLALTPLNTTYTMTEGDTLPDITCKADCRPDCTFVWTRPDNTNFTVSSVLSLGQLDRSEHGTYRCTARNVAGESTITISVNVQYGPGGSITLTPQQDSVDVMENQTVSNVTCSSDCRPLCTYTWSKDGTDYPNPLSLSVAMRNNAGQYTCTASNTVSQGTKDWNLIVRFPPQILSLGYTVDGADVTENGPKSLICSVESFPPSTIQWFYKANGTVLLTSPDVLESTYTLTNAGCLDTGLYTCSVRNSVSTTAVTRDILINVLCEPRLDPRIQTDSDFGLATTETLTMRAVFLSNPEPTYNWSFQGSPGTSVTSLVDGQDNFAINNRFITTNLSAVSVGTRSDIRESWFGVYNVTATNNQGSHTLSFTASAKGKPDPPDQGKVVCPDTDRATLSWTSGFNGGSSQTFLVGVRTDAQRSIVIDESINISDPGRDQTVTTTVSGLTAGTKTYFTVYAVNEFGNASFAEEVNCTTAAATTADNSSIIGPVVGGIGGAVVILVAIAAVVVIKKRKSGKKGDSSDRVGIDNRSMDDDSEDGMKPNVLYESSGLKPNVLYESSGPLPGSSSEYAVVDKSSPKKPVSPSAVYAVVDKSKNGKSESPNDLYAEVVKPKAKNGKENKKKGKGKKKGQDTNETNVYANSKEEEKSTAATGRQKNKEGLIYLDVVFKDGEKGTSGVTHGIENRTDYADVDFTKNAPPLPPENE